MKRIIISIVISLSIITALGTVYAQSDSIPEWIKNTAGYWADDIISDNEFFNLIQFLIDNEIIIVPNTHDTSEINQLKAELNQVKRNTATDIQNAYNDGYQKGKSESTNLGYSCEDYLRNNLATGFALVGTSFIYEYTNQSYTPDSLLADEGNYWISLLTDYRTGLYVRALPLPDECYEILTEDDVYLMGLGLYFHDKFVDTELIAEDMCEKSGYENYAKCYLRYRVFEG